LEAKKTGPDASCRSDSGGGRKYRGPDSNRRPADYEDVNTSSQVHEMMEVASPSPEGWPTFGLRSQEAAFDPDLASLIEAWPDLPRAVKAGIMAIVRAIDPGDAKGGGEATEGE